MNKLYYPLTLLYSTLLLLASCQPAEQQHPIFQIKKLPTACQEGGMPNLFQSNKGDIYLSWIEFINDTTDALMFSMLKETGWSEAREIARGYDWFVNWADFPSLLAFYDENTTLLAHWLQKSTTGTYDYDILLSFSKDGGKNWSSPQTLNDDGIAAEHGFVSLQPLPDGTAQAVWLDGRNTKTEGGAMSVRTTTILPEGIIKPSLLLDERSCDCCQTDLVQTPHGLLAAYRDRSPKEIRDIALVRQNDNQWSQPEIPLPDEWNIAGCPVNGPALASRNELVALAWYTRAKDTARVQIAFSKDGGKTFGPRFRIDNGYPLGRVDVVLSQEGTAYVSWLEQTDTEAEIQLCEIAQNGQILLHQSLVKTSPARDSGFPILINTDNNDLLLAYTQINKDGKLQAKTILLSKAR